MLPFLQPQECDIHFQWNWNLGWSGRKMVGTAWNRIFGQRREQECFVRQLQIHNLFIYRPRLMRIVYSENILIENLFFLNSPYWTCMVENVDGLGKS